MPSQANSFQNLKKELKLMISQTTFGGKELMMTTPSLKRKLKLKILKPSLKITKLIKL
jgi:hypothetical protein